MKLKKHNRYAYSPITERQDFTWPDNKRLAFYCALNVEHFSFGEGLGHTPTALGPQPDVRNFGWRDYGLRVGIWPFILTNIAVLILISYIPPLSTFLPRVFGF